MQMKNFLITSILMLTFLPASRSQHTLLLKSGEKMQGKVISLSAGVITFDVNGSSKKYAVEDVNSISFGESQGKASGSKLPSEPGEKSVTANNTVVRYKVADRTITRPPKVDNLTQEKGTVVVNVTIDKYGSVRKAVPGAEGSTTKSEYLMTKAKQAAESALFDKVPNAPLEQTGYIVIVF